MPINKGGSPCLPLGIGVWGGTSKIISISRGGIFERSASKPLKWGGTFKERKGKAINLRVKHQMANTTDVWWVQMSAARLGKVGGKSGGNAARPRMGVIRKKQSRSAQKESSAAEAVKNLRGQTSA